jgi:uncharacterized membrane protein YhaH (DUF805 family)
MVAVRAPGGTNAASAHNEPDGDRCRQRLTTSTIRKMGRLPLVIARRCALAQVIVAVLVALIAFMFAVGTAHDTEDGGAPSLDGVMIKGCLAFGIGALAVGAALCVLAKQLNAQGRFAWWAVLVTEVITVPVLTRMRPTSADGGAVLWIVDAVLTIAVVASLLAGRSRRAPAPTRITIDR